MELVTYTQLASSTNKLPLREAPKETSAQGNPTLRGTPWSWVRQNTTVPRAHVSPVRDPLRSTLPRSNAHSHLLFSLSHVYASTRSDERARPPPPVILTYRHLMEQMRECVWVARSHPFGCPIAAEVRDDLVLVHLCLDTLQQEVRREGEQLGVHTPMGRDRDRRTSAAMCKSMRPRSTNLDDPQRVAPYPFSRLRLCCCMRHRRHRRHQLEVQRHSIMTKK